MTVRELVEAAALGLAVRAGHDGLDREIRWVHATELLDPSPYLHGGELVHTVALWRRSPRDSDTYARALAGSAVSAVALGVGPEPMLVDETPPDLVEAFDRHGVPLLEVPNTTPFVAISEFVIEAIMGERRATAERSLAREQRFVRATAGDGGIVGILRVLADELRCDCWVLGAGATPVAGTGPPLPAEAAIALVLAGRRAAVVGTTVRGVLASPALIAPIRPAARPDLGPLAHLVCARPGGELPLDAGDAIAQAVEILALEYGHVRVVQASERRFAAQLMESVAHGRVSEDEVVERVAAFGIDHRSRFAAVVAASRREDAGADDALNVAEHVAAAVGGRALTAVHDGEAVALVACPPGERDLVARLVTAGERAVRSLPGDVAAGVSSAVDGAGGLRRALVEARQARRFAELRRGGPAVATSREVGSHTLLLALNAEDVRAAFRASLLGPLLAYDAAHRTELVHTLDTFLGTCGGWQRTASLLHVHVNTLRYRIARIEALTGRDLGSMDDRVDFHLALRLHEAQTAGA
jgi:sugar diacid utilization regulator